MTATLYCFGESGNAYKAALTMALCGYDWQPRFVDFFNGETRGPDFRALNPMGEVPVMVEGDRTFTQSGTIQAHVAHATGRMAGVEDMEVLRWVLWDNHKLSSQAGTVRFLSNFLPEAKRPGPVIDFLKARLNSAYKVLDAHLDGREWIAGQAPSIADCACAGYLYYPEPFGFVRADWPNIDTWLARLSEQPGWKHPYDLMPGSPADRQ
ncbi:glutathione S-transferase [Pararhodobacter sp. SW119]|uniref:glutathione S-transferase family protein n=1 Tax=Pararhodobacter sp. SW119 TaxID=2780075 RepID=UPI001ADED6BD|nr:glutathione S-transferase [Pararhodobacter sp. SW119]